MILILIAKQYIKRIVINIINEIEEKTGTRGSFHPFVASWFPASFIVFLLHAHLFSGALWSLGILVPKARLGHFDSIWMGSMYMYMYMYVYVYVYVYMYMYMYM